MKEQLNVRIIGLDHQIEEIKRQINDQEKEKDSSSQKIEEINEKKKRSEIECHNAKRIEETLIAERRQIQEQMDQKREKYHRVRSNYETMRNMAERYDGYGFGIKKVMEQQAVTSGMHWSCCRYHQSGRKIRNSDRDSSGWKYSEHCNGYAENSEEDDRISEEESLWKSYVFAAGCSEGKRICKERNSFRTRGNRGSQPTCDL